MPQTTDYAVGLDFGVASIGYVVVSINKNGTASTVLDGGTFIYPSGGEDTAEWRLARATRNRFKRRRRDLKALSEFVAHVLQAHPDFDKTLPIKERPTEKPVRFTDRIVLRAQGQKSPLSADNLARAILHIARNRGMRLTRVLGDDDASNERRKELGIMAQESRATILAMKEQKSETPAEFLHRMTSGTVSHMQPPARRRTGTLGYHRFLRTQVTDELIRLLAEQSKYHPALTPEIREEIVRSVFQEHPSPPPSIGPCRYFPLSDRRMRIATDLYQTKRIYESANSIRLIHSDGRAVPPTIAQRDEIVSRLMAGNTLQAKEIKAIFGLKGSQYTLNLGGKNRKENDKQIKGHAIMAALGSSPLATRYQADPALRQKLDTLLLVEKDEGDLIAALMRDYGITEEEATDIAKKPIPTGTAPMGEKATALILAELTRAVISHTEAVLAAGLSEPDSGDQPLEKYLPYYGAALPHLVREYRDPSGRFPPGHPAAPLEVKYGRIPNPVVHKSLNAVRQIVNGLIRKRGKAPVWIAIELAREMAKTADERKDLEKTLAREQKKNELYDGMATANGRTPSRQNRRRVRLMELQGNRCPYSGKTINAEDVFSGIFDLDHILPRSKTLDDSLGNLVLSFEHANIFKDDRPPAEAFANGYTDPDGVHHTWEQIVKRVRAFKDNRRKSWRFSPDAMARFEDQNAFQQRFSTDTSYIAKTAKAYLSRICADIRPVNGFLVDELRFQWGLSSLVAELQAEEDARLPPRPAQEAPEDETAEETGDDSGDGAEKGAEHAAKKTDKPERKKKARTDHRHHVLDALVIACIPRSAVQLLQTASARNRRREDGPAVPPPLSLPIRAEAETLLRTVQASHRRDHDVNKRLHLQQAWGVLARFKDGTYLARRRVRLTEKDFPEPKKLEDMLVSPTLLSRLSREIAAKTTLLYWKAKDPAKALGDIAQRQQEIYDRIMSLYAAEPETGAGATPDVSRKRSAEERIAAALLAYRTKTGQRTVIQFAERSLFLVGNRSVSGRKPRQAYETKGNAWMDIWMDADGTPRWEVTPRILVTPELRARPSDLRIFSGDTLEVTAPDGSRILCRALSISAGELQLLPVNDARGAKASPWRSTFRFTSLSKLLLTKPILVMRNPLGAITWRSRPRNW